jgi:Tfp pilus assembly major pilin PilA
MVKGLEGSRTSRGGFTLIELLVVIAICQRRAEIPLTLPV